MRYWEETGDFAGEVGVNESVDYLYDIRTGSKTDYLRYRGEPDPLPRETVREMMAPGVVLPKQGVFETALNIAAILVAALG